MHSEDSLLDSCTRFSDYVDLCEELGIPAIASTEHGMPRSWVSKKKYCDSKGVRFLHGVEIYLTESLDPARKVRDNYHTVLIAKNMDGVRELNRLVYLSSKPDHFYYTNRISFEEFLGISDNILSTSACLASPLNRLPEDHPMYADLVAKYDFLEIQPHRHPDQIAYNQRLLDLSKRFDKRLIAGTDTHSSTPYKAECRGILMAAKGKSYGDEDAFDLTFKTFDQLCEAFSVQDALPEDAWRQAVENTNLLPELCSDFSIDTSIKYPILYGSHEKDAEKFHETVAVKFQEKLDAGVIPPEQKQAFESAIQEELRVFDKLNMGAFMLSMSELITWCKQQGMAIGTARGSVGGSRVAYVTDIIDLNPETWNTVFSRFCNEDREEIGDIDIDCVESDRPAIFRHIVERFGREKTARVASYGSIQSKAVIDEIGRALARKWDAEYGEDSGKKNPWSLRDISKIKDEYEKDPQDARDKYPNLFYYFNGLVGTKVSQSVHPAGMVISPVNLTEEYGVFEKDGENCLLLDMEEAHDTGLAKYDFLVLKTVQVIRDCCRYLGTDYPKTHEINWNDEKVWADMRKDLSMIFQFEGDYAAKCFRRYRTDSILDMSIVTACIRPSGESYRDKLLNRIPHQNPSPIIDELLKDNLGYLVYQEDTIKFLQQICGLSGSEADNVRRAIGRKQKDRLDAALPAILEGYCRKSDQPREIAEEEAREFLQIIEDSASYQFGYNHAVAYCLLGYLCGWYRCYHPLEFITAFLNNAANDDDIVNGTAYARKIGIQITAPRWGISRGEYSFSREKNTIAKGLSSIKYMSAQLAGELFRLSQSREFHNFIDVLYGLDEETCINSRQLEILIKLDFFAEFGNQRELLRINSIFTDTFKKGTAKQIPKANVDGTPFGEVISKYSVGVTKSGGVAKNYTLLDVRSILNECEEIVKAAGLPDMDDRAKVINFIEAMGYAGYSSGKPEDRKKLYVTGVSPLKRRRDDSVWAYAVEVVSVGSGRSCRFTVVKSKYLKDPIRESDLIYYISHHEDRRSGNLYYQLDAWRHLAV